jgi:N-acyl amino acid synthase of PEP-CTERM/exosortase system
MSRLALSKQRKSGRANIMLLRLLLWRGFLEVSSEAKLTHWLAVAEPSNIRLHARHAIHFEPIGPLVSHHGMRQPLAGKIETMLETVRREAFPVWNFITDGGRLFGVQRRELEAV